MLDKQTPIKIKSITDSQIKGIKIPPHSIEAEQSVLGALMLNNENWENIFDIITINDFFSKIHQHIFHEIQYLIELNKPADLITLSESLEQKGKLELIGGFSYLAEIIKNTTSTNNIVAYADIIHERAITREMIHIANKIADFSYNPKGRSSEELIDLAESLIFQVNEKRTKKNFGPKNINLIIKNTISNIKKNNKNTYNGITGISSGYLDLDKKTLGLQKSDFIIIAARPSMGKTTFAMNICENVAINEEKPVLIFSLETSSEQLMIRMLSSLSRIDQIKIRTGKLNNEDWKKILDIINNLLKKKNIYIDDSSRLTPTELRLRARKIFREHDGLSLIMIDYLQLMRVPHLSENRTLEIAEISRSLKSLAKELNIPVLALSQLNRSLEQRNDKHPINSDLRESGSLEQDADLIVFIYRDELYNENSNMKGIAEIIISKQRNGPIGSIKLTFNDKCSRFSNYINNEYY